jgi:hypothetical protein
MLKLFRVVAAVFIALCGIAAAASVANAQTKPLVPSLGLDFPRKSVADGKGRRLGNRAGILREVGGY